MKYYKRMNRYTLFQITGVYVPTFAASCFNLFYTWYGRQVFWIDIECIILSICMCVLHVYVIRRTQHEYIKSIFDDGAKVSARSRDKYLVDPISKELAAEINAKGFKNPVH